MPEGKVEILASAFRISHVRPAFLENLVHIVTALLLTVPALASASCDVFTIGLNKFDLANQYIGRASGGDGTPGYTSATQAMARKAIDDAAHIGVSYFRISMTGFAPSRAGQTGDLELWLRDPTKYWASIDQMMADLQAANICVIPVLLWNKFQFPAMASETLGALLRDAKSNSWQMAERYVREFVIRYNHSPNILFYELTNELNLEVDLDVERNCIQKKNANACALVSNFSTSEMNEFLRRLASVVRSIDRVHKISSGYSLPRPAAEHLRRRPQWSSGGADWTLDSAEELQTNLRDIHTPVDIISVHLYPPESNRFGIKSGEEYRIAEVVQSAAAKIGKPLFIGEFGQRDILHAPESSYESNMMLEIEKLKIPYSAVWVWEYYQFAMDAPYQSVPSSFSLEPGYTDKLIAEMMQINASQQPRMRSPDLGNAGADPIVVLTKPVECAALASGGELFAVASFGGQPVGAVEFFMDGTNIGRVTQPPYRLLLSSLERTNGIAEIEARACSMANKCSTYKTRVVVGQSEEARRQCESKPTG